MECLFIPTLALRLVCCVEWSRLLCASSLSVDRAQMRSGTGQSGAQALSVKSLSLESANSVVYSQGEATRQRPVLAARVLMRRVWG